jgi:hypothetical protein
LHITTWIIELHNSGRPRAMNSGIVNLRGRALAPMRDPQIGW